MIQFLSQPWPWWFSGMVISATMFVLIFFGQSFGFSSNLRTICTLSGAGKRVPFFNFNWRTQIWNLVFLVGAVLGGVVSGTLLNNREPVKISTETVEDLQALGFAAPTSLQPSELFGMDAVLSLKGFLLLAAGGLLVGFGSRWAGGCTSGHAISGISDLQVPSMIAVVGFFLGGLLMTHILFPLIF